MSNKNNMKLLIDPLTGAKIEHGFTGIFLPSELLYNENLSWLDMILMGFIHSLSKSEQGCFASNKYFAEVFGLSEQSITNSISRLKKEKLIEQKSFDGRRRILKSKMKL